MSSGLYNTHKADFDKTLDLTKLKLPLIICVLISTIRVPVYWRSLRGWRR